MAEEMAGVTEAVVKANETDVHETGQKSHPPKRTVLVVPVQVKPVATFKIPAPLQKMLKRPPTVLMPPAMAAPPGGYECSLCNQNFFSFPQLVRHKQFHDEERPFPCCVCGKRFLSRSHYNEHQRVHTGERPFPCDQCERSFTTHHNLKRHQTIHSKEDVYRCRTCGVLFCQKHVFPVAQGSSEPQPELEHDSNSDPEPIPPQNTLHPIAKLVDLPVNNAPPKLRVHPLQKSENLRQYRLLDKLQQQLQEKLQQKLNEIPKHPGPTDQSSSNSSSLFSANLYGLKKMDKKRKKGKKRSNSVSLTSALVPHEESGSVHNKSLKMHRIAYDIEVVL